MPRLRLAASRTTAKTSGSIASSSSPLARRPRNSGVFVASASSLSLCISGSNELTAATVLRSRATSRSLPSRSVLRKAIREENPFCGLGGSALVLSVPAVDQAKGQNPEQDQHDYADENPSPELDRPAGALRLNYFAAHGDDIAEGASSGWRS